MKEVVRDGQGRQGEEIEEANKLAPESIRIIPIAKETTSQFPVSVSALNSCFTYIWLHRRTLIAR